MARARLASKGSRSGLVLDGNGRIIPVMPWGAVHEIGAATSPEWEAVQVGADVAVVTLVAIGVAVHWAAGGDDVVVSTSSALLPEGAMIDVPVFPDASWFAAILAAGSTATALQVIERARA